ncbi:MAG: response regulator, partial [Nitrospinae bacterium]|nr:response regulator [Nitrospinota bacterium]
MSKNVLIVEDAKMIQKVLSGIFSTNGYKVVGIANNGLEAIDKYFDLKPDLVTMDIRMPKMDGLQALKEIKFKEDTAKQKVNAKIMMVTSVEDDVRAVKVAGLYGASDYIKKPFKTDDLLERVDRVVNHGYNFVKESLDAMKLPSERITKREDDSVSSYVIEG